MRRIDNVFSACDGMSCGQIALDELGFEYGNYYASEIDKHAIQVTQNNYPNTIQLGDISNIKGCNLPNIGLLIGGTPCTKLSFAGKQTGFEDESKLFWEYARLKNELQPEYFLLENVVMKKEFEDIITQELGVQPIKICSSLVSAQRRQRLYWTNIPNITQPQDDKILLKDILENFNFDKEPYEERYRSNKAVNYNTDKFNTLRANAGSKTRGIGICNDEGWWRKLTPTECEMLQNVPLGYTSIATPSQRYKMLGNGWTIGVIEHIFSNIK